MWCFSVQGLYEYVRPSWEERLPPVVASDAEMKSFGITTPDRPTATSNAVTALHVDSTELPV